MAVSILPINTLAGWVKTSNSNWTYTEYGRVVVGWKKIQENWYYFNKSGTMQTGWKSIGGYWYHFRGNGMMSTGWLKQGSDTWYYLNSDGSMATKWKKIQNEWYFFTPDGKMRTGTVQIDGKTYKFHPTEGYMLSATETQKLPILVANLEKYTRYNCSSGWHGWDRIQVMNYKSYSHAYNIRANNFYNDTNYIEYELNGDYELLTGELIYNYEKYPRAIYVPTIDIYADGELIYTCSVDNQNIQETFSVDVSGVNFLKICATDIDGDKPEVAILNDFYIYKKSAY